MKTSTTTNSELFNNKVKATVSSKPQESGLLMSSPSLVELCAGFDSINVLSWSQVNVNTSGTCILVIRIIYEVKMTCLLEGE